MIGPARLAAVEALRQVHDSRAALPDALHAVRERLQDPRDVALATEIAVGTLRWRGTIDFVLAALCSRPIDRLDAWVLDVLRVSVHQLLHLERIPASAIVHDAVELARHGGHAPAAGLVNAVLRRAAAPGSRPHLPDRPGENAGPDRWVRHLAVTLSHPEWLVERWCRTLGVGETEARLRYNQQPAVMTLRAHKTGAAPADLRERLLADGVETEPARWAPDALVVRAGQPLHTATWREGGFLVQDEGSQLVALFVGAGVGDRVLDVCASPGGKATAIAGEVGAPGLVVAGDVRRRRVSLLRQTVSRLGARVNIVRHDGLAGLPYGASFDRVLVDAPCSGIGTLRRDPDLKWRRTASDLASFAEVQARLLAEAARAVRPGGRLVYATCSSEDEENDLVADGFLLAHPWFAADRPGGRWQTGPLAALLTTGGRLVTRPERDGLDSYFAAMFRRVA